jgi:hypothetical protein
MIMSKLVRVTEWRSERPCRCRHCGEHLRRGEPAIIDTEESWLSFHESCLQGLGLDPVVRLYDEMTQLSPKDYKRRLEIQKDLERLESDVARMRRMFDGQRKDLPESLRPGVRRVPIEKRRDLWRRG